MSYAEWMAGSLAAVVLGLTLSAALGDAVPLKEKKVRAMRNCRMILVTQKLYASDHGGNYSDRGGKFSSSNQAFRHLFEDSILDSEATFGCPDSIFTPDGNIGKEPDFSEALKPGENHWAMTAGLTDSDAGSIPLVYENPAQAVWPARWNTSTGGVRAKGQAWSDGTILIGTNDTAVHEMNLAPAKEGAAAGLEIAPYHREEVFGTKRQYTILDVEPPSGKP